MAFESPAGFYEGMDMTTTAGMYNITASDYDSNIFSPGAREVIWRMKKIVAWSIETHIMYNEYVMFITSYEQRDEEGLYCSTIVMHTQPSVILSYRS